MDHHYSILLHHDHVSFSLVSISRSISSSRFWSWVELPLASLNSELNFSLASVVGSFSFDYNLSFRVLEVISFLDEIETIPSICLRILDVILKLSKLALDWVAGADICEVSIPVSATVGCLDCLIKSAWRWEFGLSHSSFHPHAKKSNRQGKKV